MLAQEFVDFELVVVDDGSTDGSATLLDALAARDARVRVLHQENRGLTLALVRGCAAARGEFIARHDADDLSLPGRLARQTARLQAAPDLAFVSCWSRVTGPRDELLFESRRPTDPAEAACLLTQARTGPVHGSVMFRTDAYRRAGGYREAFRYAQDWDLWLRLIDVGGLAYEPAPLYEWRIDEHSLSAARRSQQIRLRALAAACRTARRRGASEDALLAEAARVSARPASAPGASDPGISYFIGKCLLDRGDPRCLCYLRRARRERPWSLRPWLALLLANRRLTRGTRQAE